MLFISVTYPTSQCAVERGFFSLVIEWLTGSCSLLLLPSFMGGSRVTFLVPWDKIQIQSLKYGFC